MPLIFVDVEAGPAPGAGIMTEFGAVEYTTRETFHGLGSSQETFVAFDEWISKVSGKKRPIFVSDNVAFDWQWINYYFWKWLHRNPFGHSGRRISDFYAGLVGDFYKTQEWKSFRVTPHDHNPVNDAMGNVEAFARLLAGERPGGAPS